MYIVIIKRFSYEPEKLLVDDYEELQELIRLIPLIKEQDVDKTSIYEVISVKKYDCNLAKDFITEAKGKIKPKGLVFGSGEPKIYRERFEI